MIVGVVYTVFKNKRHIRIILHLYRVNDLLGRNHYPVTQGGQLLIGGVVAPGAGHIGFPADTKAGLRLGLVDDLVVSQCGDLHIGAIIAADAAFIGAPAYLCAGFFFCSKLTNIMPQLWGCIRLEILTASADMVCIAVQQAGGRYYRTDKNTIRIRHILQYHRLLIGVHYTHAPAGDLIMSAGRLQGLPGDHHQRQLRLVIGLHVDIGEADHAITKVFIDDDHTALFAKSICRGNADTAQNRRIIGQGKVSSSHAASGFHRKHRSTLLTHDHLL